MKNKKYWIATSIVTLLPILVGLLLWDQLPDKLPTHFGVDGAAELLYSEEDRGYYMGERIEDAEEVRAALKEAGALGENG